jgi:hypothetical protein
MNLDSKGGVRAAQILAVLAVLAVIGGLVYGAIELLHFVETINRLD